MGGSGQGQFGGMSLSPEGSVQHGLVPLILLLLLPCHWVVERPFLGPSREQVSPKDGLKQFLIFPPWWLVSLSLCP